MKSKLTLGIGSAIIVALLSFVVAETPLEKIIRQLAEYTNSIPVEKVYVQTDKPYYAYGEDIWLKAYVVVAKLNEPSTLSRILYVDLVDEQQFIRKSIKLEIVNGLAKGNIPLLEFLPAGKYRLRAYTNYMRNSDDAYFFEKWITIGSVTEPAEKEVAADKKQDFTIQFFPEGGQLINGFRCKTGIKAVQEDGTGVNLSGYISNNNDEKVAVFTTEHAGMGACSFTPKAGEKYTAIVILADGKTKRFPLPTASASGFVLSVNRIENQIRVLVSGSEGLLNRENIFVVAQNNGVVYATFPVKVQRNSAQVSIPKDKFPTGIVQFTLFSGVAPVAERLIFVQNDDALKIEIKGQVGNTAIGKESSLNLFAINKRGKPVQGDFSMSVVDETKVPYDEDNETTILSQLLLTADLRGVIEQPNYYFNHPSAETEQQLDNLMLTQGWRRFTWEDVANGTHPPILFDIQQAYSIAGKVVTLENKAVPNAKVMMVSTSSNQTLLLDTISDANGRFNFDRLDISDSSSIIIRAVAKKGNTDVRVIIDKNAPVTPRKFIGKSFSIQTYLEETQQMYKELSKFNMLNSGISIDEVKIKAQRVEKPVLAVPNSANATGVADAVVTREKLDKEMNLLTVLSKMPGVMIKGKNVFMTAVKRSSLSGKQGPMLLIIDGNSIPTGMQEDVLSSTNVRDLEGIEALTSTYNYSVYGPDAAYGVLHITTKKGDEARRLPTTHIVSMKNLSLTPVKEFYVPSYADPKMPTSMKDLRSTIYWNPSIKTNSEGTSDVNYLNASTPGKYKVIVEGMDADGNMGRSVYRYDVK